MTWAKCGCPDSGSMSSPFCHDDRWRSAQPRGTDQSMPLAQFQAAYFCLPYAHTWASSSNVHNGIRLRSALPVLYLAPDPLASLFTSPMPFSGLKVSDAASSK